MDGAEHPVMPVALPVPPFCLLTFNFCLRKTQTALQVRPQCRSKNPQKAAPYLISIASP
jgi:hypothetical protein